MRMNALKERILGAVTIMNDKDTTRYKGYVGSVEFSEDDGLFYGKVQDVPSLISYEGANIAELIDDFHGAVDDYIVSDEENDEILKEIEKLSADDLEIVKSEIMFI